MTGLESVKAHARELYSQLKSPWPASNRWSTHTRDSIASLLAHHAFALRDGKDRVLNVGSHGNRYGLPPENHFHTDLVEEPLAGLNLACVADAEQLPFSAGSFDLVVCVGSVINYCAAARAIKEFGRVLRPGGRLMLEFETSDSFEFLFTSDFSRDVTLVNTFYNGEIERIYVYGRRYVQAMLLANDFQKCVMTPFHLISPLAYRLIRDEQLASTLGKLDGIGRRVPGFRSLSANVFATAQKA
jgi:SAM-dependent methyltransferase